MSTERAARGQAFAVSEAHEESMENTEAHDTTDASTTAMSSSDETQDFGSNEPSLDDDDDEDEDSDSYDAAADGYESFVKKWRAQMDDSLFATPAARVDAHKASCAEGRRSANEKRKKRQTESIDGEVFRPRERIKTQADFNRVGRFGKNFNGKHLRVQWLSNEGVAGDGGSVVTNTRLGIKTPKKQIKRAVDRNLVKRRVRDVFRKNKESWPTGVDMVVYCTAVTLTSSYEEMKLEMKYWGKEVVPRVAERGGTEAGGAFGAGKKKPWKKRETAQPAAVSGRKIFKNSEGPQESKTPETGVCAPPEGKEKTAGKRGKGTAVATAEE